MPLLRYPTELIGTVGNDVFYGADSTAYFGRLGNDVFYATPGVPTGATLPGDPLFMGGSGNDTYVLANNSEVIVAENGSSSGDVVVATGMGLTSPNTYIFTIDGRHLGAGDLSTGQAVIVLDWLVPQNRIETIILADGTFSFAQIQAAIFSSPNYLGNVSWEFAIDFYSTSDVNEAISFYTSRNAFLESKRPPVVTPANANVNLLHDASVVAATLFTVTDPDGDAIQKYELWDGGTGNGYFSASGAQQPANVAISVPAGSLAGISWVAGKTPVVETVYVRAYDGIDWSSWANWTMTTVSRPPVATPTAAEHLITTGDAMAAATLFNVSDADGDAVQQYEFWDGGTGGGFLRFYATLQPSGQAIPVSAAQLAQVAYVGGVTPTAVPVPETVWVRANDGILWGPWASWTMTSQRATNSNPVVSAPDRHIDLNQWRLLSEVFSVTDANGDPMIAYQFVDDTAAATSGYLWVEGVTPPAGTTVTVNATGLAGVWVRGGSAAGTDTIRIRATDGYDANSWSAWTPLSLTTRTQPNRAPVADAINNAVQVGQTVDVDTLFGVSDADGDALVSYELWDGSGGAGRFRVGAVDQPSNVSIVLTPAQLATTVYVAGAAPSSEALWVRAYDGQAWSAWEAWTMFTHNSPGNIAPAASAANRNIDLNQWRVITELVTVSDADGPGINQYQVRDTTGTADSGYLWADGVSYGQGATVTVSSLANTWVRGGAAAGADTYEARAFDGVAWGAWAPFTMTTRTVANRAPVANAPNNAVQEGQTVPAGMLFGVSDADGDALVSYELWDGSGGAGRLRVGALDQPANFSIMLTPAQLATTVYVAAAFPSNEVLWVRAYDGQAWSAWEAWTMFTHNNPGNIAPVASAASRNIDLNQWRVITELVTVSDADGPGINQYQVRDTTGTADSGNLWADGVSYGQGATVTVSSLANTWVRGGAAAGADTYEARAFDGVAWGAWAPFTMTTRTQPNRAPVVTPTAPIQNVSLGGTVAADALFDVSDADVDLPFSLELWDGGAGAGHFSINAGPAQPSGVAISVSPAQLALTEYVGAATGGETLWVRAYDGQAWSDWKSWTMNVA